MTFSQSICLHFKECPNVSKTNMRRNGENLPSFPSFTSPTKGMNKSERRRVASKHEEGRVDLISKLPDGILLLILSRLESTEEVIRSSILSKRWRHLWTAIPSLELNIGRFDYIKNSEFKEFVYWVLLNRSVDLDRFCIRCVYSASTVRRWIQAVVNKNVKQLDLMFDLKKRRLTLDYEDVEMPHCLVTCSSLEVLGLCLYDRGLRLPNVIGFPALRVLELTRVDLLEDHYLVNHFLESCLLLEDLRLMGCIINKLKLLCISCPKLKKLQIRNYEEVGVCDGIKISCPNLVFLKLTGVKSHNFFFNNLDSLKEAVIKPMGNTTSVFPGISHVESLWIDFDFFCQCIDAARDPVLPNLKTLVLTTFDAFTMDELNRILSYYPKLESLNMIFNQVNPFAIYPKIDEAEINKVEFIEFNGEKPRLVTEWWHGSSLREMVFGWGNEAMYYHWRRRRYMSK